jgi:predicted naringenin-chalcone synthase
MPIVIAGIGVHVPPHRQAQEVTAGIAQHFAGGNEDQTRLLYGIYRGAGVDTRHSVLLEMTEGDPEPHQSFYGESSPTTKARMRRYEVEAIGLALGAAQNAIHDAGISTDRVTHLITVSCSGFFAPGVDIALIKRLGLGRRVARTHVGFMGCHGMLNGLRVAGAFLAQDPEACVLLIALEMCSLHHQYGWDVGQVVANALFADGAAAIVAVAGEPRSAQDLRVVASGSQVIDGSEDAMSWRIGDHGFLMSLSQRIPELIARNIRAYLEEWLSGHGFDLSDVASWAVHPGGPRILTAFCQATGVYCSRLKDSFDVLAEYGNMSSPTVFFIIDRMRRRDAPRPIVALGFGPGMAIESVLLA